MPKKRKPKPRSMRVIDVQWIDPRDLEAHPLNPKDHPREQLDALETALEEFGFAGALIAYKAENGRLRILDGHARRELVAGQAVPVLVTDFSESEAAGFLATFDPLGWMAEVDGQRLEALTAMFEAKSAEGEALLQDMAAIMSESEAAADFVPGASEDVEGGDGGEEREGLHHERDRADETEAPEPSELPALVAKWKIDPGTLYEIPSLSTPGAAHRLLCGDATNPAHLARVIGPLPIRLVHADPPYGMKKQKDGVANDNLNAADLDAFQRKWFAAALTVADVQAAVYIWGNAAALWRFYYTGGLREAAGELLIRNEIVWDKGMPRGVNSAAVRMYPTATERCLFFMLGDQVTSSNSDKYWEGWEPIRSYLEGEAAKMGWGRKEIEQLTGTRMYPHWFTRSQFVPITAEHYETLQRAAEGRAFTRAHTSPDNDGTGLVDNLDRLKADYYGRRGFHDNTHEPMTDVWQYNPVPVAERWQHATPKPEAMIRRIIRTSCPAGEAMLSPFCGSGTDVVAAEQSGRVCYTLELMPEHCAATLERLSALGLKPKRRKK